MAIEKEYKYLLTLDQGFETKVYNNRGVNFSIEFKDMLDIEQGYLNIGVGTATRIRKAVRKSSSVAGNPDWYFTFKQKIEGRDGVIEIETRIDEKDAIPLWNVCVNKLKKRRYSYENRVRKEKYDIDFFIDANGENYFILAEVEMPQQKENIPNSREYLDASKLRNEVNLHLPEWLRNQVLYEVELTDGRFSNTRLSDCAYARKLYQKIRESK